MAKLTSLLVGLAGLVVAAAIVLLAGRSSGGGAPVELGSVAAMLDARVRETAAGAQARAQTIAELPRLAAAVSTDSATVRGLTQEELAFRPRSGEIIAIGQLLRTGVSSTLLQIPDDLKTTLPLLAPGLHLLVLDESLMVCDVVPVAPHDRADELSGLVAVAAPVDTRDLAARLGASGMGGRLELGNGVITLGVKTIPAGAAVAVAPLASDPDHRARLVVEQLPAERPRLPLALAGLLALAALGLAAWLGRSRRTAPPAAIASSPDARSSTASATAPSTTSSKSSSVGSGHAQPGFAHTDLAVPPDGARRIGRYTIVKPLGSGGMAEVFLARSMGEAGFERLIALKVMHRFIAANPVLVDHFLDEAKLASRLTHPNIVQILDLGRADDEYYIAMEYIEGADLERLLHACRTRGEQVPTRVALAIVRRLCDGLHAAHTATDASGKPLELVHRDVKSANVFIARSGAVKIGDFGIAKANQLSRNVRTEVGTVKGTAAYMAPEHRLGKDIDRRADLFAVGAVAYELLAGIEVNLDLVRVADKPREEWPHLPHLTEVRPDLPPELHEVVWKALAFNRDDRYGSCAELEIALEVIAERHGLVASDKVIAQWVAHELEPQSSATGSRAAGS